MIVRKTVPIEIMLLAAVVWAACPAPAVARAGRYLAVFADGRRVSGDDLSGWHEHPGSVRLGGTVLSDPKRPLLWLRDRSLEPWQARYKCPGYIEFVGGDRIVGRVVGAKGSSEAGGLYTPAHVLLKPAEKLPPPVPGAPEHVRILPGRIQRIVWGPPSKRRLNPGNLYCAGGRRLSFVGVRWRKDSVTLLLDKGTCDVKLSEVAEIHMPRVDPWKAYYRELATLSPSLRARLLRFETTGGLIATGSEMRFGASAFRTAEEEWQSWGRRMQLDRQIQQLPERLGAMGKAVDLARKSYTARAAELQKLQAADRQTYEKALAALKLRTDEQRKTDEAKLAEKHRKFEEQLRKSEETLARRLAKTPADKRERQIRELRTRQARLRESRKKLLESGRLRLQKQREQKIESFVRTEPQRIGRLRRSLVSEIAKLKRKVDSQVANLARHTQQLKTLKMQRAGVTGPHGNSSTWSHIIHPVWSLDPLWIPFRSIHMRWSFAPEKLPLSRVRPIAAISPALLPWRANRNSAGGALRSGGQRYAWGFGVHARSELSFTLPPHARSFHCRLGLDHIVDTGGCVRARIYVGSTRDKPRYESPLMIGSQKTADTGWVSLAAAPEAPRRLILQVDPVARNHPPNADPLNIRDKLDWLDPQIALDPGGLGNEVRKLIAVQIAAWRGWTAKLDKRGVYTWAGYFDRASGAGGRFMTTVRAEGQPLILSREITVGAADKWLAVDGGYTGGESLHAGSVTLRVADTAIPAGKIPVKQLWMRRGPPLIFPIAAYKGRKVTFELKRSVGGRPLYWRSIGMVGKLPAPYHLAQALEGLGKGGMQVAPGLAGVLASERVNKQTKQAALEVNRLGGEINYRAYRAGWFDGDHIVTTLIGCDWKGGDDGLMLLEKLPGLSLVVLAKSSGVSKQAVDKLKAAMPELRIFPCERSPSAWHGPLCSITVRNRRSKEVALFHLNPWGRLQEFARLRPGEQMKRTSGVGSRYEAHLITKDYNKSKPISRFLANPNAVWDIKSR